MILGGRDSPATNLLPEVVLDAQVNNLHVISNDVMISKNVVLVLDGYHIIDERDVQDAMAFPLGAPRCRRRSRVSNVDLRC